MTEAERQREYETEGPELRRGDLETRSPTFIDDVDCQEEVTPISVVDSSERSIADFREDEDETEREALKRT